MVVLRGEIYLVALDPTVGHEIAKSRPSVIVSPNEMNSTMGTVLVAPMTSKGKHYPMRVACRFKNQNGLVLLDQIRAVDRIRLIRKLGHLPDQTLKAVQRLLVEMFT